MRVFLLSLVLSLIGLPCLAADQTLASISGEFFKAQFKASPAYATSMGIHDYDLQLDEVDKAAHVSQLARLNDTLHQTEGLNAVVLSQIDQDDRAIFIAWLKGQILEETTIQMWRRNPDQYVGLGLAAVNSLVTRTFAPPDQRMRLVISRESQIPRMLRQAEAVLADMPPIYIETALEDIDGAHEFLAQNVPDAFTGVTDSKLKHQLQLSTKAALASLERFKRFLVRQKPLAHGQFALGRANIIGLLQSDLVDASPEQVLAAGEAQLARDRADYDRISAIIDPAHPDQAFDEIGADHPTPEKLIATARDQLAGIKSFIEEKHIITLPFPLLPDVRETPAFMRAMVFGAMDWPGPFETKATESYYYITPPDAKEPAAVQEKFMTMWNRPMLENLSVHEALPGHFVQGLYLKAHPDWSLIRKAIQSYTATEGWAHYTEQMMQDEGLGNNEPAKRLAQLNDALLRDCRLVVSIKMHVQGMTLQQAAATMKDRCAVPDAAAYKEARRGTGDPGYYSYTLGKLEILKLREDVKAEEGAKFSLQRFHDRFLSAGLVPINIIRREMLGRDGPSL